MTTILPIQDVSYFRIIWQKYSNGSNALYIQYPSDTMKIEISAFLTKVNLESNDLILEDLPEHKDAILELFRKKILTLPYRYIIYEKRLYPICEV